MDSLAVKRDRANAAYQMDTHVRVCYMLEGYPHTVKATIKRVGKILLSPTRKDLLDLSLTEEFWQLKIREDKDFFRQKQHILALCIMDVSTLLGIRPETLKIPTPLAPGVHVMDIVDPALLDVGGEDPIQFFYMQEIEEELVRKLEHNGVDPGPLDEGIILHSLTWTSSMGDTYSNPTPQARAVKPVPWVKPPIIRALPTQHETGDSAPPEAGVESKARGRGGRRGGTKPRGRGRGRGKTRTDVSLPPPPATVPGPITSDTAPKEARVNSRMITEVMHNLQPNEELRTYKPGTTIDVVAHQIRKRTLFPAKVVFQGEIFEGASVFDCSKKMTSFPEDFWQVEALDNGQKHISPRMNLNVLAMRVGGKVEFYYNTDIEENAAKRLTKSKRLNLRATLREKDNATANGRIIFSEPIVIKGAHSSDITSAATANKADILAKALSAKSDENKRGEMTPHANAAQTFTKKLLAAAKGAGGNMAGGRATPPESCSGSGSEGDEGGAAEEDDDDGPTKKKRKGPSQKKKKQAIARASSRTTAAPALACAVQKADAEQEQFLANIQDPELDPFKLILEHDATSPWTATPSFAWKLDPNPDFLDLIQQYFHSMPPNEIARHIPEAVAVEYAKIMYARCD